ncbi:MAG: hypothetical protein QM793_09160 [Muricomes sp.]
MKKKLLSTILTAAMILSLAACAPKEEANNTEPVKAEESSEVKDTSKSETIKTEKNLLSVEITLPASLVGDSTAELDEEMKEAGVMEVTKNPDGSITMKMSKTAHKALLSEIKTTIDDGIGELLADKETYPSFDSVTYNDDLTEFNVNVDPALYGGIESLAAMVFYLEGNMYQAFNAVPENELKTIVNFKNKDTGELIESGDSSEANFDEMLE